MSKRILSILCLTAMLILPLTACGNEKKEVKIGVSFGVGEAVRWVNEQKYMEDRAKELGVQIETRLNRTDEPKTQQQDCYEMIDSGIDVLILIPRDVTRVEAILTYAKQKKVQVVSYARVVLGQSVDLLVGYDSNRMGQKMGQYLTETVFDGDYILLSGSENDNNAKLLYEGAMRYIEPAKSRINVILDTSVPDWSKEAAKQIVMEAVSANNNKVDAILAPNDILAGACVEALKELGVTQHVAITGMDAELGAVKRIVEGTQDSTVYMDLKVLANTAIEEAVHLAKGEKVNVNAEFDNQSGSTIKANLITGELVVKENIDRILIDSGYFTYKQVYGE